jgi:hypothetical protein
MVGLRKVLEFPCCVSGGEIALPGGEDAVCWTPIL